MSKSNTPEYRKEWKEKHKKHQTLDIHRNHKKWDKSKSKSTLDIDEIDYYINNDLPLDEYYDSLKLYDYEWKHKKKGYNLNMEMRNKKNK